MFRSIFIVCVLITAYVEGYAQNVPDSVFTAQAKSVAIAAFEKEYGAQTAINRGVIFRPADIKVFDGSTYLGVDTIYKGKVLYDGEWYNDIDLVYDIKSDNLIHVKPIREWIVLSKEMVKSFTLDNKNFINVKMTDDAFSGYYQLVYDGKVQLLAKYRTEVNNYNAQTFKRQIEQKVSYIIHHNNEYYEANSKSDVLRAFKDKRNEVADFIKKQKIDFKKSIETAITEVIIFYQKLS